MLRKVVIFLILTSMVLHCASRMNFLSYLYAQRQEIAFALGLIDEIPIAVCHHDYDFDKGLTIVTHDSDKSHLPPTLSQAREIILFFQFDLVRVDPRSEITLANHLTILHHKKYTSPGFPIFHPPA
ncbi:hypothetical protein [Chryseolinea lacunae]|uniref:Uncharacterized protein n=1 Tax=Chryseolinea lacunae TaxID=2801331 RepID=A0ABS1KMI5_9BACT|nr:hypothetical protein [Chryseolinea lacunae]MBL0740680.1 hypothetical protein [Chryseolinea lacunae]